MQKRKLRFVKRTPPAIGICEPCNAQFKSDKPAEDAKDEISAAFAMAVKKQIPMTTI
jgi:hypothetical protein